MRDAQRRAASLFSLTLALGCAPAEHNDSFTGGTSSTSTPASASESGSVTSAAEGSASATDSAPTTSTGTPTTSGSSSSTGQPCSFLCGDMGPGTCDIWVQDCPEGQKCAAYISGGGSAWDAVKCVEVTGTDEPGDPCTSEGAASSVDSCIKGAMCWNVNAEGVGTCVALCAGSPEAPICPKHIVCTFSGGGVLNLCLPTCDPLLQDCANPAEVCYPIADSFTCAPDASGDEGQANDPCEFINVCDEGLMCAEAALVGAGCEPGSTGCCTPFCKFPDAPCPNPDQQCLPYFDPMQLPVDDPLLAIGVCGVPG